MIPVLTAPPQAYLVLSEVKDFLRIPSSVTDDDTVIDGLMKAAEAWFDGWSGYLGRCVAPQKWTIALPAMGDTRLPFPDAGVATVKYHDATDIETTLPTADYTIGNDERGGYILFGDAAMGLRLSDRDDPVSIEVEYGFAEMPERITIAAKMLVSEWYYKRGAEQAVPPAVYSLVDGYRRISL